MLFIKKWFKKSLKNYYEDNEKFKEMIENYITNGISQEKKFGLQTLLKIQKETVKTKK